MCTHNIPFLKMKKKIHSAWIFSTGHKNEFKTAVVNKSSVFEPLKFCVGH